MILSNTYAADSSGWGLFALLALMGVIWLVYGDINTAWYSLEYGVSPDKVHINAKPTDCDFMRAPLGSKGCHYQAAITAYDAGGLLLDTSKYRAETIVVSWIKKTD